MRLWDRFNPSGTRCPAVSLPLPNEQLPPPFFAFHDTSLARVHQTSTSSRGSAAAGAGAGAARTAPSLPLAPGISAAGAGLRLCPSRRRDPAVSRCAFLSRGESGSRVQLLCAEGSLANLQTSPNPRWGPERQSSPRVIGSWCVGSDGAAEITAAGPPSVRGQPPSPTPRALSPARAAFRAHRLCCRKRRPLHAVAEAQPLGRRHSPCRGPAGSSDGCPLHGGKRFLYGGVFDASAARACFEKFRVISCEFSLSGFLCPPSAFALPRAHLALVPHRSTAASSGCPGLGGLCRVPPSSSSSSLKSERSRTASPGLSPPKPSRGEISGLKSKRGNCSSSSRDPTKVGRGRSVPKKPAWSGGFACRGTLAMRSNQWCSHING